MKLYRLVNDSVIDFVTPDAASLVARLVQLTHKEDKYIHVEVEEI